MPIILLSAGDDVVETLPLSMLMLASNQASWRTRRISRMQVAPNSRMRSGGSDLSLSCFALRLAREDLPDVPPVSFGSPQKSRESPAQRQQADRTAWSSHARSAR